MRILLCWLFGCDIVATETRSYPADGYIAVETVTGTCVHCGTEYERIRQTRECWMKRQ